MPASVYTATRFEVAELLAELKAELGKWPSDDEALLYVLNKLRGKGWSDTAEEETAHGGLAPKAKTRPPRPPSGPQVFAPWSRALPPAAPAAPRAPLRPRWLCPATLSNLIALGKVALALSSPRRPGCRPRPPRLPILAQLRPSRGDCLALLRDCGRGATSTPSTHFLCT